MCKPVRYLHNCGRHCLREVEDILEEREVHEPEFALARHEAARKRRLTAWITPTKSKPKKAFAEPGKLTLIYPGMRKPSEVSPKMYYVLIKCGSLGENCGKALEAINKNENPEPKLESIVTNKPCPFPEPGNHSWNVRVVKYYVEYSSTTSHASKAKAKAKDSVRKTTSRPKKQMVDGWERDEEQWGKVCPKPDPAHPAPLGRTKERGPSVTPVVPGPLKSPGEWSDQEDTDTNTVSEQRDIDIASDQEDTDTNTASYQEDTDTVLDHEDTDVASDREDTDTNTVLDHEDTDVASDREDTDTNTALDHQDTDIASDREDTDTNTALDHQDTDIASDQEDTDTDTASDQEETDSVSDQENTDAASDQEDTVYYTAEL